MMHRTKKENDIHEGKWNGLWGKHEQWETPEKCVVREMQEEAWITITDYTMHGMMTAPMFDGKKDWVIFIFTATAWEWEVSDECVEWELAWIDTDKLLDLNLREGDKKFISLLEEPGFFSVRVIYEKKVLKECEIRRY